MDETRAAARPGVEAVERALKILEAFSDGTPRLSLTALARRTGLYPSTILRLAASLDRCGYLRREEGGDFRLGPALLRMGGLYQASFDLADHIRPALRALAQTTGETACFYVREAGRRICLYRVNAPRSVRTHLEEGAHLPLDRGAAGRILLAFAQPHDPRYAAVRAQAHAISQGERDPDLTAVAVPVLSPGGELVGALGIVGPRARMDAQACAAALAALQAEAADVMRRLGR